LAAILAAHVKSSPVVVMVDDLHLASESMLQLVVRLASLSRQTPLLLLGVGRTIVQPALLALEAVETLHLTHLSDSEMATLVAKRSATLPRDQIDRIVQRSAGVPLFAATLADQARLAPRGEILAPPLTLVTLILSRLDVLRLDRLLLAIVARVGQIEIESLKRLWQDTEASLVTGIDRAVDLGILAYGQGRQGRVLTFRHPLLIDVLRFVLLDEKMSAVERVIQSYQQLSV
jgi:hypothetical protein